MREQKAKEVERFRKNLINSLHNIQKETKTETIRIDKLITLIQNAE
nr:MAG TPA: hypothetical protein [Caudoviricetes sp.]